MKRTFQRNNKKKSTTHGFLSRKGKSVLSKRRKKGRKSLSK